VKSQYIFEISCDLVDTVAKGLVEPVGDLHVGLINVSRNRIGNDHFYCDVDLTVSESLSGYGLD